MLRGLPLWLVVGCQPTDWPDDDIPCDSEPLVPGEVYAGPVECADQLPAGSDARNVDSRLANSRISIILRHPQDALTVRQAGGLTVIDAAPWDRTDRLHEMVPIVSGGWLELDADSVVYGHGTIDVEGWVRALPGLPPPAAEGERRSGRWVIEPDVPWVEFEGAEGLWVHPEGEMALTRGVLQGGGIAYATDGEPTDLGGVVVYEGATRLITATAAEIWSLVPGGTQRVTGTAEGAGVLSLIEDGRIVAGVPLTESAFDLTIPTWVDAVRAQTVGRASSAEAPVGTALELPVGARGTLTLQFAWDARPRPVQVRWAGTDGRVGTRLLPPEGGVLNLGAGVIDLTLSAGPTYEATAMQVQLGDNENRVLGARLIPDFDPGNWVATSQRWPSDRSRDWRGTDLDAANRAAGEGLDYAIFSPEDEPSGVVATDAFPRIALQSGSVRVEDGFTVAAWPFGGGDKKNLRGGVMGDYPEPRDALSAMWGGPKSDRYIAVDLGWLELSGAPPALPNPDFVHLDRPPGVDASAWSPWFDWLDASVAMVPTGPLTWVPVIDPTLISNADVEQPLIFGTVCASTGPLLTLTVDGHRSGEVAEATPPTLQGSPPDVARSDERVVTIELLGGTALDHLVLLSEGGEIVATLDVEPDGPTSHTRRVQVPGRWIVAAAWADDDSSDAPWAVTGPVWTRVP